MTSPSLLNASLAAAVDTLAGLCRVNTENEETFTGVFMGAIAASSNLLSQSGLYNDEPNPIWWGSFSKNRGPDMKITEPGSGADFALCLLPREGYARLIIFQAKKSSIAAGSGVKPTEWYADLNRIPKDLEDGTQRDPQIFMLAETGRRIQALSEGIPYVRKQSKEVHKLLLAPGADVAAVGELGGLSWIHYLIYTLGEPVCVPLSKLGEVYKKELGRDRSKTKYSLPGDTERALPLLRRGVQDDPSGWLLIDPDVAVAVLPLLAPLMHVVVADASGRYGPTLQASHQFSQVAFGHINVPLWRANRASKGPEIAVAADASIDDASDPKI
ncbi:hypothetical protein [Stenotrophomonas sp. 364]|uniref:hypothetical protein n=1 Tax=Stenotrophomonas sp. 364 TaxID=2691571 RepID=UPI001319B53E|nr:hypothetical protein [Stenotrophomonas sp. 364]QHB72507.1 hypothetical protein GQ674_14945 [Stenotrophomonas sp. 364]